MFNICRPILPILSHNEPSVDLFLLQKGRHRTLLYAVYLPMPWTCGAPSVPSLPSRGSSVSLQNRRGPTDALNISHQIFTVPLQSLCLVLQCSLLYTSRHSSASCSSMDLPVHKEMAFAHDLHATKAFSLVFFMGITLGHQVLAE